MGSSPCSNRVSIFRRLSAMPDVATYPGETLAVSPCNNPLAPHTLCSILYYDLSSAAATAAADSLCTGRLKMSLFEVLTHYPFIAGRLAQTGEEGGRWVVRCTDAGIRVSLARVDSTMAVWLASVDCEEEKALAAWEEMPGSCDDFHMWPPFRLQLSLFKGGGLAIGVSCTHMLADPTSLTLLLKTWMDHHNGKPILPPPPSFHLPFSPSSQHNHPFSNTHLPNLHSNQPPSKMVTIMFRFSCSTLEKFLRKPRKSSGSHISPFDLLAALFWSRIARLRPHDVHMLSIGTDLRRTKNEKVPMSFFGNAIRFSMISMKTDELEATELGGVAEAVHVHVMGIYEADGQSFGLSDVGYGDWLTCMSMDDGRSSTCFSSEESSLYSVVWGENRPTHVASYVGNVGCGGLVLVFPMVNEEGGRVVMVTLLEDEMKMLQTDEFIEGLGSIV